MVADSYHLRALQVCVTGHWHLRVRFCFRSKLIDYGGHDGDRDLRRLATVEPEIEGDLLVARSARVKRRAGRGQLGQPALDGRMDVLVGVCELEFAIVELLFDLLESVLDVRQLGRGDHSGCLERPGVGHAALDVEVVEVLVNIQRGGKPLQLRQQLAFEAAAPQFLVGYGVSLLTSPSRALRSRSCSRPCTVAAVRTPIPHSLMNPAAADWSN